MSPRWPATADTPDLGDIIAHFSPLPSRDPDAFPVADDPALTRWAPNANRQELTRLLADNERLFAEQEQWRAEHGINLPEVA